MSKSIVLVHPQIKKIIENLDLELDLELSRYENSHPQESILIPNSIVEESMIFPQKELNTQESSSSLVYNAEEVELEEPIPVASRLISDRKSLLDVILTPWGIIGIILFFGANIFIFFSQDKESLVKNNSQSETPVNNIENQNQENNITENNLNLPSVEKTDNNQTNTNINNLQSPSLPLSLPEINNSNSINNNLPKNSVLYPDLKSALFAEIQKNQQPLLNNNQNSSLAINNSPNSKIQQKYYLLSNYQNIDNFNSIKKIAPNAQMMNLNQEMKIQLGIFNTEIEAKNQGQKLINQGIKVYIQPINNID